MAAESSVDAQMPALHRVRSKKKVVHLIKLLWRLHVGVVEAKAVVRELKSQVDLCVVAWLINKLSVVDVASETVHVQPTWHSLQNKITLSMAPSCTRISTPLSPFVALSPGKANGFCGA